VQATSLVDLATTWLSTTGTPTAIKLNVTDTANVPAASNLLDLQVGGVSKFKVNKAGRTMIGNVLDFGTSTLLSWENPFLRTYSPFSCTSLDIGASGNLILANDAPGILAQRNGVNKQALRVYNTNLSGAPEWAEFDWITSGTGNTLKIGTNKSGDGGARPIDFVTGGVVRMSIGTTGTVSLAQLDVGGSTVRNNYIEVPAAGQFSFSGRCTINSGVDGNIHIQSSAGGNFGRLQLGGTTSAFPAIKRNGTGIDIVLANDSGFAPLSAGTILGNVLQATTFSLIGASSWYYWTGRGGLSAPSDGVIKLGNNADNGFTRLEFGATNLGISRGTGSPEGVVTALVGSLYLRTDGGLLSTLYVKESSPTPNTGWVAK
jgi:hypothetical protein